VIGCFQCTFAQEGEAKSAIAVLADLTPLRLTLGTNAEEEKRQAIKRRLIQLSEPKGGDRVDYDRVLAYFKTTSARSIEPRKVPEKYENKGVMNRMFGIMSSDSTVDHPLYHKYYPEDLIDMQVFITDILECEIDMALLKGRNVKVHTLLQKGYGLLEWICLDARWTDLIDMGLRYTHLYEYQRSVPIGELIVIYEVGIKELYEQICEKNTDLFLRLCRERMEWNDFKKMKNDVPYVVQLVTKVKSIWELFSPEEWASLGIERPTKTAVKKKERKKR